MTDRQTKVSNELQKYIAQFISRESNRSSLITVTKVTVSPDFKQTTVHVSILPKSSEETALKFLERQRKDIRAHIKKNLRLKRTPFVQIKLDEGEQNRQKIDVLLNNT